MDKITPEQRSYTMSRIRSKDTKPDMFVRRHLHALGFRYRLHVPNHSLIEITSPGGLPRGQTAARALAGYSKIRNDVLAKALNYMRFIEEWGSGLRRVNKVFADYGLRDISLEEAGFAIKMNVYRVAKAGNEVVNPDLSSQKRKNKGVNKGVNEVYNAILENPGIRTPALTAQIGKSTATVERAVSELKKQVKIEFRGAPKTGWYHCKDERHA